MRRLLAVLLSLAFLLPLLTLPVAAEEDRLFPQTGKHVQGDFLAFYDARGGEAAFGLPLTDTMTEYGRTVQYFSRARLEAWPENPPGFRVQLGLLGVQMGKVQPAITAEVTPGDPLRRYFPETGHVVAFAFKDYWESRGGLEMFGYPTTELLVEGDVVVQYFQRVRMEWHPGNPAGSQVVMGDLGLEYVRNAGWPVPNINTGATPTTATPVWDGVGRILFHQAPGSDIYSVRPDGSDLRRVGQGMDPAASPDGSEFALASWYPPGIFVNDANGTLQYQVKFTSHPWEVTRPQTPAWSADGRLIAFLDQYQDWRRLLVTTDGRPRIADVWVNLWRIDVVNVQTGQVHTIEQDDFAVQPSWSPDDRLVFVSTQGLFVVQNVPYTKKITKIANTDARFRAPSWSPDGEWIAIQWRQHDHEEIGLIRPDGSGFHLLTSSPPFTTPVNNITPVWSPDGKSLAFLSDRGGQWELFVMNADGSDQHKVDIGGLSLRYDNTHERILSWSR